MSKDDFKKLTIQKYSANLQLGIVWDCKERHGMTVTVRKI